jgi:pimeloyl-ACP methyl ester carboxylesterase
MAASAFADPGRRLVDLGRAVLDVVDRGGGPPLLFLHGFPEFAAGWLPIIDRLAPRFRCIAPDQRGFGYSSRFASDAAYAVEELLADVTALLDHLPIEAATLIGHDWGGIVASWFAARQPERVERLVLINGPHPAAFQEALLDDAEQRAAAAYIDRLRAPGAAEALLAHGPEALWERLFGSLADAAKRDAYVAAWADPAALDAMLAWYRAAPFVVPGGPGAPRPGWLDQEAFRIVCPTLILWGMEDRALLPSLLDRFEPYFENLRTLPFPDAGHALIHEQPQEVARLIEEFAAP